jgi:hypothetical protein
MAISQRPNVFVAESGQTTDIGTLMLGGQSANGLSCVGIGVSTNEAGTTDAMPPEEAP